MHTLPTGATPFPKGGNGQVNVRGWDFYYGGLENENPKYNVRSGARPVNFFPNDRMGSLDGDLLSKMGLTTERMVLGDALFSINCCFQFAIRGVQVFPGMPGSHSSVMSKNSQTHTLTQSDSEDRMGTSSIRLNFMSWLILTELL